MWFIDLKWSVSVTISTLAAMNALFSFDCKNGVCLAFV